LLTTDRKVSAISGIPHTGTAGTTASNRPMLRAPLTNEIVPVSERTSGARVQVPSNPRAIATVSWSAVPGPNAVRLTVTP
jgi:hypothetical protein